MRLSLQRLQIRMEIALRERQQRLAIFGFDAFVPHGSWALGDHGPDWYLGSCEW